MLRKTLVHSIIVNDPIQSPDNIKNLKMGEELNTSKLFPIQHGWFFFRYSVVFGIKPADHKQLFPIYNIDHTHRSQKSRIFMTGSLFDIFS